MDDDVRRELDDLCARVESLEFNTRGEGQLWHLVRDHEQRFDTLQTAWWKRIAWWFWPGWPWYDLNANRPRWRRRS